MKGLYILRPELMCKFLKLYKKPHIGEQRWQFYLYICTRRIAGSHEPCEEVSKQPCRRFKSVCMTFKMFALCYKRLFMT